MYTITNISEKYNLPASTIRYYEEIGLLENVEHAGGYRRVFNDSHMDRMAAIECFKKARLPLDEIKKFFEYEKDIQSNSSEILAMMKAQEAKTLEEMENLSAGLAHIQKKIKYYTAVDNAIKEGRPIPGWCEIIDS